VQHSDIIQFPIVRMMKILDVLSALVLELIASVKQDEYDQATILSAKIKKLNDIIDNDTIASDLYFDTVFYGTVFDRTSYHINTTTTAIDRRWILTTKDLLKDAYEHHEYVFSDICKLLTLFNMLFVYVALEG